MRGWILAGAGMAVALGCGGAGASDVRSVIVECAACHGDEGIAKDVEVPNLAGQRRLYLYKQLVAFRKNARKHKEMRVMSREMNDADMRAIAEYYSSLPPR